jgi:hypothetical protein
MRNTITDRFFICEHQSFSSLKAPNRNAIKPNAHPYCNGSSDFSFFLTEAIILAQLLQDLFTHTHTLQKRNAKKFPTQFTLVLKFGNLAKSTL